MIKFLLRYNSFDNLFFSFEIEICADYCERKARQCGEIFGELRPNIIVRILSQGDYIGMYMYVWYVYWYSPRKDNYQLILLGKLARWGIQL